MYSNCKSPEDVSGGWLLRRKVQPLKVFAGLFAGSQFYRSIIVVGNCILARPTGVRSLSIKKIA